ncbi:regulatory peptide MokC, partial [Escherichia coli O26:H11 str. CVM10021]
NGGCLKLSGFRLTLRSGKMKPQEIFLSILGLPLRASTTRMVVPSSHGGNINMLTKYALVAVIVLCLTVLGFTLLVGD